MELPRAKSAVTVVALMLLTSLDPSVAVAGPKSVRTPNAACERVKTVVAARGHFDVRKIAFCDIISKSKSPRGYYVLALHSDRQCEGICSSNMGWYAVQAASGGAFEWDVSEMTVGPPIPAQP